MIKQIMILAGSALMIYNIVRYVFFLKKNNELEGTSGNKWYEVVPLFLLVFFFVGYVIVGIGGLADLLMAFILLGGSIFVFLLLWVMYTIIGHVRDTEQILAARYEDIRQQISAMTKDANAVFRVNLTRDEVEEKSGDLLYDSDLEHDRYSELIEARRKYVLDPGYEGTKSSLFTREGLLKHYQDGFTGASEVVLVRRADGAAAFVKLEATLTKKPVSGDVVAFMVESTYNEDVVRSALLEKVLMGEYDRIAYIINGRYKVLISNTGKKEGLLLKDDEEDSYESIYYNCFLPAMDYDRESGKPNPLRLSVIENALAEKESYDVDAPFEVDGKTLYKHFVFYKIDEIAKFYLMLLTDSTGVREEQEKRNRELSEALDAAVRSNESRVRFFSNVSHNLRTPMNGILGYADLAKNETDPEKCREYVAKIGASGRKLVARLNDLFDMSLIDSGTLKLEKQRADVAELAQRVVSRFDKECAGKEISITADTSGVKDTAVLCDGPRVEQIIDRLIENSVFFAPEKSDVTLSVSQDDGGYLFAVKNKGKKIPKEVAEHIFEPETWMDNREIGDVSGADIGMAVTNALIDLMGGTASVRSQGDDVDFEVRLPLETVKAEKAEPENELGALKLLVVDDNEINREIANLILTGEGHEVELAENGAEAVEKVQAGAYDAVLMDVQMPVMNGYEATAAIRALPDAALAAIPIIAMTANAYQEDRDAALKAGMDGYVPKPINPDEIHAALAKALRK